MARAKRVVVIDHRFLIRAGLENLMSELREVELVKTFEGNETRLSEKVLAKKPDLVIVNPHATSQGFVNLLNNIDSETFVIGLVSNDADVSIISHFRQTIFQNSNKSELQKVFRKVLGTTGENHKKNGILSDREITVLKYVVKGYTNRQIADELFLSIHTIMTHRKNIIRKLGINTVSGLTVYALMNKLVIIPKQ